MRRPCAPTVVRVIVRALQIVVRRSTLFSGYRGRMAAFVTRQSDRGRGRPLSRNVLFLTPTVTWTVS